MTRGKHGQDVKLGISNGKHDFTTQVVFFEGWLLCFIFLEQMKLITATKWIFAPPYVSTNSYELYPTVLLLG